MREVLDAPTLQLPMENVDEIRAFLDGQSRLRVAVWVRHEQRGQEGPLYDHHLVLAVDDEDWATGDLRALEDGMEVPPLRLHPTWIDLCPVSEVEALRAFGTVLWERTGTVSDGLDPLDFRLTYEPLGVPAAAVEELAGRLREVPEISRVEASLERLWKGGREIKTQTQLWVALDARRPGDWEQLQSALRTSGVLTATNWSLSSGLPREERIRTAMLYER